MAHRRTSASLKWSGTARRHSSAMQSEEGRIATLDVPKYATGGGIAVHYQPTEG